MALAAGIVVLSLVLLVQGAVSLYLSLYHWNSDPDAAVLPSLPADPPTTRMTILIPARAEEDVIAETLWRIARSDYPQDLLDVAVICHSSDHSTIVMAGAALATTSLPRVKVVTYGGERMSKPRGLNFGLRATSGEVVSVIDAEDDVSPGLFRQVDAMFRDESISIVQGGVQLMNLHDRWFSVHNCLEYFYWFRSRLHFHARIGAIPLGGNTVFFRREALESAGGWDEATLTEDAEIGVRLSVRGHKTAIFYDPSTVTREETPATVAELVRQRTRWQQGFIQVLLKGEWLRLPTFRQRVIMAMTLVQPLVDAATLVILPASLAMGFVRLPAAVALVSLAPLFVLALQALVAGVGVVLFCREFALPIRPLLPVRVVLTHLPYQLLLVFSGCRAIWREAARRTDWEKTGHTGAHRVAGAPPVA